MARRKRGHGEGSITQRKDGRWMGAVTVNIDPATGKPMRKYFYGKTRSEVARKVREALNLKDEGRLPAMSQVTLGEWGTVWLNDYKKQELKVSTYESYRGLMEDHIIPELGAIKLDKLRTNDIQRFYNAKAEGGRKDGKSGGLSPRTVKYIHTVLSGALKQAVKEGYIAINPAAATTQPRQVKSEITPLTAEQARQFLYDIKKEWLYPVYITAIGTGLRRGEVLGLQWGAVDLGAGTAQIKRQLIQVRGKVLPEEYTKTKGSMRTIALPDIVTKGLRRLRRWQDNLNGPVGKVVAIEGRKERERDYVFCWPDGSYIRPDYVYTQLKKLLHRHGLPSIRFHDLRHTFATMLLEAGEHPKVVSEMLGHSSITVTLDTYSHVLPAMKEKAAAAINDMLKDDAQVKPQG